MSNFLKITRPSINKKKNEKSPIKWKLKADWTTIEQTNNKFTSEMSTLFINHMWECAGGFNGFLTKSHVGVLSSFFQFIGFIILSSNKNTFTKSEKKKQQNTQYHEL